ncbi:DAK2 domain-containing protein [Microlunatus speluncae]|uniref:DAK2 domain-containing protein n=1 Tax=Microlunatus speluncae TaxID=2594267 RepID=UPI001266620A|nr:DAK2 domain-containing protein [Microlunatus speluncae]
MSLPSRPSLPDPALTALTGWLRCARDVVAASAAAIDAINVFPAPDADTGTNVTQTLTGIVDAAAGGRPGLSRAAVVSAHGNSGAVIGQMVAIAIDRLPVTATESCGTWLAATLRAAAAAATAAVADPVRGTVLSVADAAAEAAGPAAELTPDDGLAVAVAAERAAAEALERTTEQLRPLRDAGVVDAGGLAYLLLLRALVQVLGGASARPVQASRVTGPATPSAAPEPAGEPQYEVMYLLEGADLTTLDRLRERLSAVADSVVVVTARTPSSTATAQVHAHLSRPTLALAPGLAVGTVSGLRVTPLGADPGPDPGARQPLVIIDDPGYEELVRGHGGRPLPPPDDSSLTTRLAVALARSGPDVIMVLPPSAAAAAETATAACAGSGRRVEPVPADDPVQALCALAVHEPTAELAVAATAMRAAAGRVRTGVAAGVDDGWRLVDRLAGAEPELITIITGPAAVDDAAELGRRVAAAHPRAELELLSSGAAGSTLLIGVES